MVANNTNTTPNTPSDEALKRGYGQDTCCQWHQCTLRQPENKGRCGERSVNNNWSTIVLPFTANVPAGSLVVELKAENEVTGSGNRKNFTTVSDKMQAGRCYLIKTAETTATSISTTDAMVEPDVAPETDAQFIGNTGGAIVFDDAFRSLSENVGYEFYVFSSNQNLFVKCHRQCCL